MGKSLLLTFLLVFALGGCSSLETPDYQSPSFRGPGERPAPRSTQLTRSIELEWPVPTPAIVNQKFKSGSKRIRHQGIDLGGPRGTSILAAHEGTIIYTGRDFRGFGKMIIIESPQGYATFYAHLDKIQGKEGQWVNAGQRIGAMGKTGRATGVHLHFELRIARVAVDPLPYLPLDRNPAQFRD
jgi:murein DD-endopeptidase MepM/ murein hydrolase activator NlpD